MTNGYDNTRVMTALSGRLGWLNPTEAGKNVVDTGNQSSTSGRYFNDGSFHAAVTVQNIISAMDDPKATTEQINGEFVRLKKAAINSALSAVFSEPQIVDPTGFIYEVCENSQPVVIGTEGKFVGHRICISDGFYAAAVKTLTFYFDADCDVTLYLFNGLKKDAIWTKTISVTGGDLTVYAVTDMPALTASNVSVKSCEYYLGYFQNAVEANALDLSTERICKRVISTCGFEATASGANFIRFGYGESAKTYGLNVEINSYRDYTNRIVDTPQIFDELIGLQLAAQVIEGILNSTRNNEEKRAMFENVMSLHADLAGSIPVQGMPYSANIPYSTGIRNKIRREVKVIKETFFKQPKTTTVQA